MSYGLLFTIIILGFFMCFFKLILKNADKISEVEIESSMTCFSFKFKGYKKENQIFIEDKEKSTNQEE